MTEAVILVAAMLTLAVAILAALYGIARNAPAAIAAATLSSASPVELQIKNFYIIGVVVVVIVVAGFLGLHL